MSKVVLRLINRYRVLNGCPYCGGAFFCNGIKATPDLAKIYKCFHCGRMYQSGDGCLKLWLYREYEHLGFRWQYSIFASGLLQYYCKRFMIIEDIGSLSEEEEPAIGWEPQRHINGRTQFAIKHRLTEEIEMDKALPLLGLELIGVHHRELDDVYNASRILQRKE